MVQETDGVEGEEEGCMTREEMIRNAIDESDAIRNAVSDTYAEAACFCTQFAQGYKEGTEGRKALEQMAWFIGQIRCWRLSMPWPVKIDKEAT